MKHTNDSSKPVNSPIQKNRLVSAKKGLHGNMGRKVALIIAVVMVIGITTAFAAENALKTAFSGLYDLMQTNKTTVALNDLNVKVLENSKTDADEEAAKIFAVGVYEQGFDNTVKKTITPLESQSEIAIEKMQQELAPLGREKELFKAIQSYQMANAQLALENKLFTLTKEETAAATIRYEAGIISEADYKDKLAAIDSAELNINKLKLSIASAALEVNKQTGMELSTEKIVTGDEEAKEEPTAISVLPTKFADMTQKTMWLEAAYQNDSHLFSQMEDLRFLDLKLKTAKDFIPDTHSRVIEMKRDREDSRLTIVNTKTGIEVNLLNKLNDRLSAVERLELSKKDLDMANRQMSQAKLKLDAGLYGRADIIPKERMILQTEFDVMSKMAALNQIEVDLRALTGMNIIDTEVAVEE